MKAFCNAPGTEDCCSLMCQCICVCHTAILASVMAMDEVLVAALLISNTSSGIIVVDRVAIFVREKASRDTLFATANP